MFTFFFFFFFFFVRACCFVECDGYCRWLLGVTKKYYCVCCCEFKIKQLLWFVISNSTWYIASVLLIIGPTPVWTNAALGRRPIERNGPSNRHNLSPRSFPK